MSPANLNFQPAELSSDRKEFVRRKLEAKMLALRKKAESEVVVFKNETERSPWYISSFL